MGPAWGRREKYKVLEKHEVAVGEEQVSPPT